MSKIRIIRTQIFEYDPYDSHKDYCERDPECTTVEAIMAHDKEDLEGKHFELRDLVEQAQSTTDEWEIVNESA